jgi:hypothetical protein
VEAACGADPRRQPAIPGEDIMIDLDTGALFTQYLNVVNRTLATHRDEFPYQQMISAGQATLRVRRIGVAVYQDDPQHPHDWLTIHMDNGKLAVLEHGKADPDITWRVKERHLEAVTEHSEESVDHPVKLDFDWLKTRIGIQSWTAVSAGSPGGCDARVDEPLASTSA